MGVVKDRVKTDVGAIPSSWSVCNLSEISTKITDGDHLTPIRTEQGYYLLSARNVRNGRIDVSDVDFVGKEEYYRMKERCNPEFGDVLISCSGTIGRVTVVPPNFECVLVRSAALAKLNRQKADGHFIQFWLQSGIAQEQIAKSVNQGAQPNLFLTHIEKLNCPVPPLEEQVAIAGALSDVDALLGVLDRMITKKRDLKQAAMQQLLTGQTRLPGFKGDWEEARLGELCKITTGHVDANAMNPNGQYAFFTCAREVYRIDKYLLDAEALLVSGNGANVGYIHYYQGKFNAYQRTYVLTEFSKDVHFLKFFMDVNLAHRIELEVNAGNTPYIKMGTLTEMTVWAPPTFAEQTAIAEVLSDMDAELSALARRREKTQALKQGMMQELLTGKTRLVES